MVDRRRPPMRGGTQSRTPTRPDRTTPTRGGGFSPVRGDLMTRARSAADAMRGRVGGGMATAARPTPGQGAIDFGRRMTGGGSSIEQTKNAIVSDVASHLASKGIYQDERGTWQIRGLERNDPSLDIRDAAVAGMGGPSWQKIVADADARLGANNIGLPRTGAADLGLKIPTAQDIIAGMPKVAPIRPATATPSGTPSIPGRGTPPYTPGGAPTIPGAGPTTIRPPINRTAPLGTTIGSGGPSTSPNQPVATIPGLGGGVGPPPGPGTTTIGQTGGASGPYVPVSKQPANGWPQQPPLINDGPPVGSPLWNQMHMPGANALPGGMPGNAPGGTAAPPATTTIGQTPTNGTPTQVSGAQRYGAGAPAAQPAPAGGMPGNAPGGGVAPPPSQFPAAGQAQGPISPSTAGNQQVGGVGTAPANAPGGIFPAGQQAPVGLPGTGVTPPGITPGGITPARPPLPQVPRPGQMPRTFPNGQPFGGANPMVDQIQGYVNQRLAGQAGMFPGMPGGQQVVAGGGQGLAGLQGLGQRIGQSVQQGLAGMRGQQGQVTSPNLTGLQPGGIGASVSDIMARVHQQLAQSRMPQAPSGMPTVGSGVPTGGPTTGPTTGTGGTLGSYGNASIDQWDQAFIAAGNKYGVDPTLLKAMMDVESGGNGNLPLDQCRSDGSCGPMQVKPGIWGSVGSVPEQIEQAAKILGDAVSSGQYPNAEAALFGIYFPTDDVQNGTTQGQYADRVHQLQAQMGPYQPSTTTTGMTGQPTTGGSVATGAPTPNINTQYSGSLAARNDGSVYPMSPGEFQPKLIVYHITDGSNFAGADTFQSGGAANYVIAPDGQIYEMVAPGSGKPIANGGTSSTINPNNPVISQMAQQGADFNAQSISIEVVGTKGNPPTPQQIAAGQQLTAYLSGQYSIPMDTQHVVGHSDLDSVGRGNWDPYSSYDPSQMIPAGTATGGPTTGAAPAPAAPAGQQPVYLPGTGSGAAPAPAPQQQGTYIPGKSVPPPQAGNGRPLVQLHPGAPLVYDPRDPSDPSYGTNYDGTAGRAGPTEGTVSSEAAPATVPGAGPTTTSGTPVTPTTTMNNAPQSGVPTKATVPGLDQQGAQIADLADNYVGSPYASPGFDPSGWDCSGFVYWIAQHTGHTDVPQGSHEQYNWAAETGRLNTDPNALQPGDIIFWNTGYGCRSGNCVSHVSIYLGNGKMIGANNPTDGTHIDDVATWMALYPYMGSAHMY